MMKINTQLFYALHFEVARSIAVADQIAYTVATLLVEHVISRHGVPAEPSDHGQNFLSELVAEVCKIMGIHQVNSTAYHPQMVSLKGFTVS